MREKKTGIVVWMLLMLCVMWMPVCHAKAEDVIAEAEYTLGEAYAGTTTVDHYSDKEIHRLYFDTEKRIDLNVSLLTVFAEDASTGASADVKICQVSTLNSDIFTDTWLTPKFSVLKKDGAGEITKRLVPGSYYIEISSNRPVEYILNTTVISEKALCENADNPVISNSKYTTEVNYTPGTDFEGIDCQYGHDVVYCFDLKYRAQLKISAAMEGIADNSSYIRIKQIDNTQFYHSWYYYDFATETFAESIENITYRYEFANAQENEVIVTLAAGSYEVTFDRNTISGERCDFVFNISEGDLAAETITMETSCTMEPGGTFQLNPVTLPEKGTAKITWSVDDPGIVSVSESGLVSGLKNGTTYVRASLPNGASAVCQVNVYDKTMTTTLYSQVGGDCYDDAVKLRIKVLQYTWNDTESIEIYRAAKKNGSYTKIKTIAVDDYTIQTDYSSAYAAGRYIEYIDKKVKSNKQYFYKVKVRIEGKTMYGDFSNTESYWTAPKNKVKVKYSGKTAKWKKVKGAFAYWVREDYHSFQGYNIFGQKVTAHVDKYSFVKKNSYKRKNKSTYSTGGSLPSKVYVTPIGKHGKYYYCNGLSVTNKKSRFKGKSVSKTAS